MKIKILLLIGFASILLLKKASAQSYCIPKVENYGSTTPGITRVTFKNINRMSETLEDYIYTQVKGIAKRGTSDSISITYTMDLSICPTMNLRVWVDLNRDGIFQSSELLVSKDKDDSYNYKALLTIPLSATLGTTRMRVALKMSDDGGHTDPTPCNDPPDPLDWHGEIEDYDLQISDAVGIGEIASSMGTIQLFPNPCSNILNLGPVMNKEIEVFNELGSVVTSSTKSYSDRGELDVSQLPPGLYFIHMKDSDSGSYAKFIKE